MVSPFVILAIAAAYLFLAYRDFKFALVLLFTLLPTYLIRFSIGPIPFTLLEVFVLIIIGVWVIRVVRRPDFRWVDAWRSMRVDAWVDPYVRPLMLLFAASCFAVAIAPDTFSALGIWKAYFVEPLLLLFVLRSTFVEKGDWLKALNALGISVIAVSIFATVQRLTGMGIPVPWDIELRATSFYDFPNAVGLFVAPIVSAFVVMMGSIPAFAEASSGRHGSTLISRPGSHVGDERVDAKIHPYVAFSYFVICFGLIACVLSQTEAAFVAIPAALLLTLLVSNAEKRSKLIVTVCSIGLFVIAFALSSTVREKLLLQDLSGQVRLSQWRETASMIADHPIFGAGLNGYPTVFAPYHDSTLYEIFQYPHNIFLNVWSELGLLGLIALFWLGIVTVRVVRRGGTARSGDAIPAFADLALVAFAALATMFIHGLVDVPFFKNDLAILTIFFLGMSVFAMRTPNGSEIL